MYCNLEMENITFCEEKFDANYILVGEIISDKKAGIAATISNIYGGWKLLLTIDAIKLLNKADIQDNDYNKVENFLHRFCMDNFGEILNLILTRIEYRYDAKMLPEERDFFLRRYKKIIDKQYFAEKKTFNTSIYHSNKSKSKIIYDKQSERDAKGAKIESYEKNVLRYEVKLLNRHLYYNMKKYDIERTLKNYWDSEVYRKYFIEEFEPILYPGNYYKLYDIMKILSSTNLKEKEIENLRKLLLSISRKGVTEARKYYSSYMFHKYINILNELKINPIVIPKNEKLPHKKKYIKNPLAHFFT